MKKILILVIAIFLAFIFLGFDLVPFIFQTLFSFYFAYKIKKLSTDNGGTGFHPLPVLSYIYIICFTIPPIIAYHFNIGLLYIYKDIDWGFYLILISIINVFGLLILYFGAFLGFRKKDIVKNRLLFLERNKLLVVSSVFLVFSFLAQILIFIKYGGIYGYMNAWTEDRDNFSGLGKWFMLAEPFPILFIFFIFIRYKEVLRKNIIALIIAFIAFFSLKLLFGGLRGSRSNTIWGLFWFAGLVHLYLFKLKKMHLILGVIFISIFMPIYGIYKTYGIKSFDGEYSISDTNRYENNPLLDIYINDFSRSSLNAYEIYQYNNSNYYPKLGATYLNSMLMLVPFLKPYYNGQTKNSASSELVYEQKFFLEKNTNYDNSRVYGIYGEALLNFGPFFAVFIFFIAGFVIAKIDNFCRSLNHEDFTIFVVPFLANVSFVIMMSDLDNLLFFIMKNGLVPMLYIYTLYAFSKSEFVK